MGNKIHEHEISCPVCSADTLEKGEFWKQKKIVAMIAAGVILAIGLFFEFFVNQHFIAQTLFLIVVMVSGKEIVRGGIKSLLRKRLDMDFLIAIATIGAFLIGHGEEGAAVIFLFSIAEFLEDYAAERAKRSIASLLKLAPEVATIKKDGKEVKVHVHEVEIGDILIIKPGDRIPLDGIVVCGDSSVNQAPITGESVPVTKTVGDEVFAGTVNIDGYLEVRVSKKSDETVISKIVKLVKKAQARKSKTEIFIDKFTRYYTPFVIILASLVILIPVLVFNLPFNEWFYKGLVLLVISCPCALAISTPVSMVSAITSAAGNGVLIKGGNFIEEIKKVRVVVFDKTGTLTKGKLEVTDIITFNKSSKREVLQIAASLESRSKHPIAEAILKEARKNGIKLKVVREFKSVTGKGIEGKIGKIMFRVGNRSFFKDLGIDFPEEIMEKLEREGKTVILVSNHSYLIGLIALMDKIRRESYVTVKELKKRGIKTVMLTGDNEIVGKAIASKLKFDEYYTELLPEDKVDIIDTLVKKYRHVAMVGDGINDAPALAKSNVGIAMGAIGSDIAIMTADIILMQDDLSKITYLLDLSEKTMCVVKQNIITSLLIKGSFMILTFPGIVTLWLAVAVGDMGLTLAVILNALRIGKLR